MPQYILRDLPPRLWQDVRERAHRDGWPLRALILQLLQDFADERVTPSGPAPMPPSGDVTLRHSGGYIDVMTTDQRLMRLPAQRAVEESEFLVVYDEHDHPFARFNREYVESWALIPKRTPS